MANNKHSLIGSYNYADKKAILIQYDTVEKLGNPQYGVLCFEQVLTHSIYWSCTNGYYNVVGPGIVA